MKIALVAITYNRLNSLKRLLDSLEKAYYGTESVDLIISIDKSSTTVIEQFASCYQWSHGNYRYIAHAENLGLRKHILSCGELLNEYDALAVFEDDITVSPYFWNYVIQCYDKYYDDDRIAGISLYNFPVNYQNRLPFNPVRSDYDVYMMNCAQSWGQLWMKKQWQQFKEWYEDNCEEFNLPHLPQAINSWPQSSWLKYHTRYCIEQNKYFVYPYEAFSTNNNDVGTHVKKKTSNYFQSVMRCLPQKNYHLPSFEECQVKYDGFFESKFFAGVLEMVDDELCVDLWGQKDASVYKHYLLSRKSLPYHILRGFALIYKPIESNILWGIEGNDIFLYDTQIKGNQMVDSSDRVYYDYLYANAFENLLNYVPFWEITYRVLRKFASKMKRLIYRK